MFYNRIFFKNKSINSHDFYVKLFSNEKLICHFILSVTNYFNDDKKVIVSCENDIVAKIYHNDVLINTTNIFLVDHCQQYYYTDQFHCCYKLIDDNDGIKITSQFMDFIDYIII